MKQTVSQKKANYHHTKANASIYDHLEDDGFSYQLIEGVLEMAPSPFALHQRILWELSAIFSEFLRSNPIGKFFFAPFDVELNDHNIYQPDLLFVSNNRLNIITEKRVVGAPDLVIEILSKGTRKLDLTTKYRLYEESGVLEYWIVDPDNKSFLFYQLKDKTYQKIAARETYSSRVLEPLEIKPSDFWQTI